MSDDTYLIPARCGEDFCECCGDCLHCYGSEECYDECGTHSSWVTVTKDEAVDKFGEEKAATYLVSVAPDGEDYGEEE